MITIGRISLIDLFMRTQERKCKKDPTLMVDSLVAYEGSIEFFGLIGIFSY